MRVAIVTSSYPTSPGDPSGHFVETEARLLAQEGEVVVIAADACRTMSATSVDPRIEQGVAVWRLAGGEAFGWPGVAARLRERPSRVVAAAIWAARARRLLGALPPFDLVIAHWALPSAFPVAVGVSGGGRPALEVVSHGADVRMLCRLPALMRDAIVETILRRASSWRFVSTSLRDSLLGAISAGQQARLAGVARVCPPALDVPDVRGKIDARRRECGDRPLLVCVGRLVPSKRFDRALDRAGTWPGARVVVLGEGPERGRLEAHARARGIDARFVGMTPREEALAWIGAADALLHASHTEGLSTVVREAEALGVRVEIVA